MNEYNSNLGKLIREGYTVLWGVKLENSNSGRLWYHDEYYRVGW